MADYSLSSETPSSSHVDKAVALPNRGYQSALFVLVFCHCDCGRRRMYGKPHA